MKIYQPKIQVQILAVAIILLAYTLAVSAQEPSTSKALICYYNSESYLREGMPFEPSKIDPTLCTHIIYSYMGMREENYNVYSRNPYLDLNMGETEPYPDNPDNSTGQLNMIRKTVELRNANPLLKIMTSIGGPVQSSRSFSNMARHIANRTLFTRSVMKHVDLFELDGIDISWIHPASNGGRPEDIETFVVVMKELRAAFTNLTTFTGKNYTLTLSAPCTQNLTEIGYDVLGLADYVDLFHLLCYDFKMFTAQTDQIGHHSPLYHRNSETGIDQQLNAAFGVNYFLELGAMSTKLVLGISAHARTYELGLPEYNDYYQRAAGLGPAGSYTRQPGFLSFFEICDEVKRSNTTWQFRYEHEYKVPSMFNDTMWIGYDNEISAKEKVDFAVSKNLGGIMLDFIDFDDYNNICEGWQHFPLASAIKERLNYWENK